MKLNELVAASRASAAFREAVSRFADTGSPCPRLVFDPYRCPPIKIERALIRLLERHADAEIDAVEIDGRSGCEFFRGTLTARTLAGTLTVDFLWDCRWRAEQQGWRDAFGFPDQIRAARVFGHDCFRTWAERTAPAEPIPLSA